MKKLIHSFPLKVIALLILVIVSCILFLTYQTYGNWDFALSLRSSKLIAFVLVGIATSFATITFQTLTHNQFLTPNILGLDSLYTLVQTTVFFFFNGKQLLGSESVATFLLTIAIMVIFSVLLANFLLHKGQNNLFLLLMIGIILATLLNSITTFLQVAMNPNEFDALQTKLFASFNNINSQYLPIAAIIILILVIFLWFKSLTLDVLHLGDDQATNLGINIPPLQFSLLVVISSLIGVSTALVGPITFLGFIVANISYHFIGTYHHRQLFIGGSLIAIFLLIFGEFMVEQVFKLNTPLSSVIEFTGGIYFIGKIIYERKNG